MAQSFLCGWGVGPWFSRRLRGDFPSGLGTDLPPSSARWGLLPNVLLPVFAFHRYFPQIFRWGPNNRLYIPQYTTHSLICQVGVKNVSRIKFNPSSRLTDSRAKQGCEGKSGAPVKVKSLWFQGRISPSRPVGAWREQLTCPNLKEPPTTPAPLSTRFPPTTPAGVPAAPDGGQRPIRRNPPRTRAPVARAILPLLPLLPRPP